jgi:hypothetical protein
MKKVATEGAKGVRKQSAGSGKRAENGKKMLLQGNEAKKQLDKMSLRTGKEKT